MTQRNFIVLRNGYGAVQPLIGLLMPEDFEDRATYYIAFGSEAELEALAAERQSFPCGTNDLGRAWILDAIASGRALVVAWMLKRDVDLDFPVDDGFAPLHVALSVEALAERHEIVALLLEAGAPVNARGTNDWTPAHMAAAYNDVQSLKLLIQHGADLNLRTRIDEYATPLEEARHMKCPDAVRFLEAQG